MTQPQTLVGAPMADFIVLLARPNDSELRCALPTALRERLAVQAARHGMNLSAYTRYKLLVALRNDEMLPCL